MDRLNEFITIWKLVGICEYKTDNSLTFILPINSLTFILESDDIKFLETRLWYYLKAYHKQNIEIIKSFNQYLEKYDKKSIINL